MKQGEEPSGLHKKINQWLIKVKIKNLLRTKIDTNPFDKEEPKEKPKSKKDDSWMKGKDGWEILDDENVEVKKQNHIQKNKRRSW